MKKKLTFASDPHGLIRAANFQTPAAEENGAFRGVEAAEDLCAVRVPAQSANRTALLCTALLAFFMLFFLGGCTATTAEYDEDYADEIVTSYVDWMLAMDRESLEEALEYPTSALDDDGLIQYEGLQSYYNILDEIGEYAGSYGDFTYKDSSNEVVVNVTAEGTERSFTIELIFDVDQGYFFLTSLSCTADYTLGEKLIAAAQNTVIGIIIVFIVLLLILFILSQLHRIDQAIDAVTGWFAKRKTDKTAKQAAQKTEVQGVPASGSAASAGAQTAAAPAAEEEYVDDTELVAVIAAAIAASEGVAPDGFVVRSIRRSDKWKRGK